MSRRAACAAIGLLWVGCGGRTGVLYGDGSLGTTAFDDSGTPDGASRSDSSMDGPATEAGHCPPGEDLCEGVCVNEQSDPGNCGACGAACSGTCIRGRCLTTIFSSTCATQYALAVNATDLYWTSNNDQCASVQTAPLGVAALPAGKGTSLANDGSSFGLALDDANVYWAGFSGILYPFGASVGAVMSVPLAGGAPRTLVDGDGESAPLSLVTDSARVCWVRRSGQVMSVPVTGGMRTTLATGALQKPGVALTSNHVVWVTAAGVLAMPVDGGAPATLSARQGKHIETIRAAGGYVYWLETPKVWRSPITGGEASLVSSEVNVRYSFEHGMAFGLDADALYWIDSAVRSAPLSGGPTATLYEPPAGKPMAALSLAVGKTALYWTQVEGDASTALMRLDPK